VSESAEQPAVWISDNELSKERIFHVPEICLLFTSPLRPTHKFRISLSQDKASFQTNTMDHYKMQTEEPTPCLISSGASTRDASRKLRNEIVSLALDMVESDLGKGPHKTLSALDDNASASTSSELDGSSSPRSIFSNFWAAEQCQQGPAICYDKVSLPGPAYPSKVYSRTASSSSLHGTIPKKPVSCLRRSIFNGKSMTQSASQPCLTPPRIARHCFHKSFSTSDLDIKPCLRKGRFSGDHRASGSSDSSSVSFNDKVKRIIYQQPLEQYATDDWSKGFSN
jgi:hypothetical protein